MAYRKKENSISTLDSSYGRLLRRLDQAMDVARTRTWLAGSSNTPQDLEVCGLSPQDAQLLRDILRAMELDRSPVLSGGTATHPYAQQQSRRH